MYTKDGQEAANKHYTLNRQKTSKALDSLEVLNPPPFDEPHSGPTLFFCPKTQIKSIVAHKASWQVITTGQADLPLQLPIWQRCVLACAPSN